MGTFYHWSAAKQYQLHKLRGFFAFITSQEQTSLKMKAILLL